MLQWVHLLQEGWTAFGLHQEISDEDHGRKNFDTFVAILRKTRHANQADKLCKNELIDSV